MTMADYVSLAGANRSEHDLVRNPSHASHAYEVEN